MRTALFTTVLLSLASGCGDTATLPGNLSGADRMSAVFDEISPDASLTSGCGDLFAVQTDSADENAVFFAIQDGIAQEGGLTQQTLTRTYTLPDPRVSIVAQHGIRLSIDHCDDAIEPGNEAIVDGSVAAMDGTVTVTFTPTGADVDAWNSPGLADIIATDVIFESPDGDPWVVDFALVGVLVGQYGG